ncbi:hypothetical protein O6H91_08G044700 [Diphasiastrum complanatum]|uniref:Uncharacterized protein n=1 Tax=Diphasiastrum complanatum TaxID=34168 RepID=A0ACC2CXD6_DIPCM|nr:hypothetical protein O6H91_08G044700 [Diphasiastrum complanatum]
MDSAFEVAVYIHRFHNLDLFQQGWYKLKVTSRWEGSEGAGVPSRVVQYEAPDATAESIASIWQIDDADHSFCSRPFRIKYARQDVYLAVMVSFHLSFKSIQSILKSSIVVSFELLFAPLDGILLVNQSELEMASVASHEFRIPYAALLGSHTYSPVHFDSWHMVLVDVTIHTVLMSVYQPSSLQNESVSDHLDASAGYTSPNMILTRPEQSVPSSEEQSGLCKLLQSARTALITHLDAFVSAIQKQNDDAEYPILDSSLTASEVIENGSKLSEFLSQRGGRSQTSAALLNDSDLCKALGSELSSLWILFLNFHRSNRESVLKYLCTFWTERRGSECSPWVVCSRMTSPEVHLSRTVPAWQWQVASKAMSRKGYEEPATSSAAHAESHRKSLGAERIKSDFLQDMHLFGCPLQQPIIFAEQYSSQAQTSNLFAESVATANDTSGQDMKLESEVHESTTTELRIVIFVHGFQGHHLDLRLVRNQWLLMDPDAEVLMSESNEDQTLCDFRELGQRLADEVVSFLKHRLSKALRRGTFNNCKLSFVGHSIGNIIIRAALTEPIMKPFLQFAYTFLSISGPHLGYLYSSNSLFNSGLWVLKKLKASLCMHQLTFTDQPNIENCYIFKLSQVENTFSHFQHVVLVSSPQDRYVPYHSARIEICQAAVRDSKKGASYAKMLQSCTEQLTCPANVDRTFIRCDVNFDLSLQGRSLNNFIGRTAHIEFLETDAFVKFIFWTYPECFS